MSEVELLEGEEFRPLPLDSKYWVSNKGRVYSSAKMGPKQNSILSPLKDKDGYEVIRLYIGSKQKAFKVHRLVMLTFVKSSELQVNHLDGDKTNNSLGNLEYVTGSQNMRHSVRLGLNTPTKGTRNGMAKLSETFVKEIKYSFKCVRSAYLAEKYKVSVSTINLIRGGKTWQHI